MRQIVLRVIRLKMRSTFEILYSSAMLFHVYTDTDPMLLLHGKFQIARYN